MLRFNHIFDVSADVVWGVIWQVDRVDWVPGVQRCVLQGDVRTLDLPGAGEIQERIVLCDPEAYELTYQCIQSPIPLEHHEARMRLSALPNGGCEFAWEADILPTNFEVFLKDSMTGALAQLIEVVARAEGS
jgi:hypothetical protein